MFVCVVRACLYACTRVCVLLNCVTSWYGAATIATGGMHNTTMSIEASPHPPHPNAEHGLLTSQATLGGKGLRTHL